MILSENIAIQHDLVAKLRRHDPVRPSMSSLSKLYANAARPIPAALADWEERVSAWCDEYDGKFRGAQLSETTLDCAVFVFDHLFERVTLAYAVSVEQLMKRDAGRMRGFPDPNVSAERILGAKAFSADKGHFLGHASGGELDINLFPQRRELNRGWSEEGKEFRRMERYVAQHLGTFFYHRPIYDDETWVPRLLEYGVLEEDVRWEVKTFANK